MGSNEEWGELAEFDQELADAWDRFTPVPDAGENAPLDAFLASKHLDHAALVRLGARMADHTVLAFAYQHGIKFRDVVTGKRWGYVGSDFRKLKIIPAGAETASAVIVSESETDAARLSMVYNADVAIMPAGAKRFTAGFAAQLAVYERVLVATDNDAAGDTGWQKIREHLPNAERFAPPEGCKDWCEIADEFPDVPAAEPNVSLPTIVFGALEDLELPEVASWFEHELLPIGGQLMLHGWAKSFKSFLAIDMMLALAQGLDWAGFAPTEEACKVCVVQWEIKPKYYRNRLRQLMQRSPDPELLRENFGTWTPLQRPRFVAGNTESEDHMLTTLTAAGVQVVLFDPIRQAVGAADMNSEQDVRKLLGFFQRVQDQGITVVACHHDNKAAARTGGGDPLGMTGSGAWSGDADTLVSVALPKGEGLATSPRRNLHFLTRNDRSPTPRGMEMREDGSILYTTTPFGPDTDPDDEGEPAI